MDAEIQIPSYFDNGVWVRDLARESMGRRWHECLQKISGFNRTHRPELFNWCQQERQFVADTKFQQPFPKKKDGGTHKEETSYSRSYANRKYSDSTCNKRKKGNAAGEALGRPIIPDPCRLCSQTFPTRTAPNTHQSKCQGDPENNSTCRYLCFNVATRQTRRELS